FLLWDAQRRAGISDAEITAAMENKLKINMERQWPEPKDGEPRLHIKEPGNSPVTPDGWISCSERMPSEEDVLVYCSDTKEQMVGFHKGKGLFQFFYMNGVEGVCEPSHWMPLPEPPQEAK
ncbi:dATP/dGTP pyrophosphohydrolase domain-containing protein, partial [Escherichia coli]